jgi:hypothetical protein
MSSMYSVHCIMFMSTYMYTECISCVVFCIMCLSMGVYLSVYVRTYVCMCLYRVVGQQLVVARASTLERESGATEFGGIR